MIAGGVPVWPLCDRGDAIARYERAVIVVG